MRASTRTRPRAFIATRRRPGSKSTVRGVGAVIMPARTVAIWMADVAPIAATSWPPNAGFHATSRRSPTSRSTASPVRPASRRAATRRQPHDPKQSNRSRWPKARIGLRSCPLGDTTSNSFFDVRPDQVHDVVGAPRGEQLDIRILHGDHDDRALDLGGQPRGDPQQLAGRVRDPVRPRRRPRVCAAEGSADERCPAGVRRRSHESHRARAGCARRRAPARRAVRRDA